MSNFELRDRVGYTVNTKWRTGAVRQTNIIVNNLEYLLVQFDDCPWPELAVARWMRPIRPEKQVAQQDERTTDVEVRNERQG